MKARILCPQLGYVNDHRHNQPSAFISHCMDCKSDSYSQHKFGATTLEGKERHFDRAPLFFLSAIILASAIFFRLGMSYEASKYALTASPAPTPSALEVMVNAGTDTKDAERMLLFAREGVPADVLESGMVKLRPAIMASEDRPRAILASLALIAKVSRATSDRGLQNHVFDLVSNGDYMRAMWHREDVKDTADILELMQDPANLRVTANGEPLEVPP
jgi:hypothetical protein